MAREEARLEMAKRGQGKRRVSKETRVPVTVVYHEAVSKRSPCFAQRL